MNKILLLLLGIFLCSIGFSFCIIYLNLFVIGYSFFDYVFYLFKNLDIFYLAIGGLCIYKARKR